jgi:ubiquinone/menaquinone biosynthesis C-methylase UbiE
MLHRRHPSHQSHSDNQKTRGLLLDRGWRYDLEVWFFDTFLLHGEINRLRRRVLDGADLSAGHKLLDVGCGTGTLAIQAGRRLAGAGQVTGVDPAPRQIARARSKARRAGVKVDFQSGVIENLSFPDKTFDTVTSTLMMHHLPGDLRLQGLAEIARVLKPRGRLILADFDYPDGHQPTTSPAANGYGGASALPDLLQQSGFSDIDIEHVTFNRPHRGWIGASLTSSSKG